MDILVGILGLTLLLGACFLFSKDKKGINFKAVGIMLALQLLITVFMFKTSIGMKIVEAISNFVTTILSFAMEGITFILGGVTPDLTAVYFINVLLVIIFTSTLLAILTHIRVLPLAIKYVGGVLSKVTGLSRVVTFNSVNSIFFGQSEAVLAIKSHLDKMNDNKLLVVSCSAMSSVSAAIVGAYMSMVPPQYVLVAMLLNALSCLIITTLLIPDKEVAKDEVIDVKEMVQSKSIFEAISQGALDGGKIALIVASMLVAYVSLMALINAAFMGAIGISFSEILGYLFAPIAWIMGVPTSEILTAGSIMGTKLATNEFVAMLQFQPMIPELTEKTVAIVSTFLISFANFSSIGIIGGSVQAINGEKAKVVAKFGLKMLLIATMTSILTATIVGLFV